MSENLEELRGQLDQIDQQMVDLFKNRMELSGQVAEYKREKGLPVLDTGRERALLGKVGEQAGEDPKEIWNVNIFGKTLEQLVDDGISGKVTKINEDSQEKLQGAMEKIVNESSGGLICIII